MIRSRLVLEHLFTNRCKKYAAYRDVPDVQYVLDRLMALAERLASVASVQMSAPVAAPALWFGREGPGGVGGSKVSCVTQACR